MLVTEACQIICLEISLLSAALHGKSFQSRWNSSAEGLPADKDLLRLLMDCTEPSSTATSRMATTALDIVMIHQDEAKYPCQGLCIAGRIDQKPELRSPQLFKWSIISQASHSSGFHSI